MELIITDNPSFTKDPRSHWVLVSQSHIISSNCLAAEAIDKLNLSMSGLEMSAADKMLTDLDRDVKELLLEKEKIHLNPYIRTRTAYDQLFGVLFSNYRRLLVPKYLMETLITRLLSSLDKDKYDTLTIRLDHAYVLTDQGSLPVGSIKKVDLILTGHPKKNSLLKNLYYLAHSVKQKFIAHPKHNKETVHLVLFMYDHINEYNFLKTFFRLVKQDPSVFLSVIKLSVGIDKIHTYPNDLVEGQNIRVYDYTLFRKPVKNEIRIPTGLTTKNSVLKAIHAGRLFLEQNLHYTWINQVFDKLKPDVCLYDNLGEVGRVMSDVARYKKVPSVVVDYGLFTDDPYYMSGNTKYDHRACLSQCTADIWKRRNDPTEDHPLVGFCKLDDIGNLDLDREKFLKKYGLNMKQKTVLFASTWSGGNKVYDHEKKVITEKLSRICAEKKWNLVIKKHPAEFDSVTNKVIKTAGNPNQVVLESGDVNLYETIFSSDLVCSQASSVFVEAMYFDKPFSFLSLSEENPLASYFTVCKEPFAPIHRSMDQWRSYAQAIFETELGAEVSRQIRQSKKYYLYETDGGSSRRLLDLLLTAVKKRK